MDEARQLQIHLGKHQSSLVIPSQIPDKVVPEVIAKLKQLGENNSVSVTRIGERENGFYGGTGIEQLDQDRYDTFLAQADELLGRYASGRTVKVVDETIRKPIHRGSAILGIIGGVAGGLVGAIAFALVAYFGFFLSYLGFVIAKFAAYGYDALGGQQGQTKRISLIVIIFLSVVAGFLLAHAASFARAMNGNLVVGFQVAWRYLTQTPTNFFNGSFFIGLVFAYLGAINILRR